MVDFKKQWAELKKECEKQNLIESMNKKEELEIKKQKQQDERKMFEEMFGVIGILAEKK